jgi:tRNA-uridine 2-sulfurtransferase
MVTVCRNGSPLAASFSRRQHKVKLHAPQRAVTPGQAAVFYRDDLVLGGGWITC